MKKQVFNISQIQVSASRFANWKLTNNCPAKLRTNPKKTAVFAIAALALMFGLFSTSFGQTEPSKIANPPKKIIKPNQKNILSGMISDNLGAGVPDVEVRLRKSGSKQSLTTMSGAEGNYKFKDLSAGIYVLEIKPKPGFRSYQSINIRIKDGGESQYDITLKSTGKRKTAGLLPSDSSANKNLALRQDSGTFSKNFRR